MANHAPIVTAPNGSVRPNQAVAASNLFGVTDADGDAITQYKFWDGGAGGGYFTVNGTQQSAQANITVSAANLSTVNYVGGSTGGSETEWVQAFDGTDWSAWISWTMSTVNHVPVVTAPSGSVRPNQAVAASTLFSVTDADSDAITQYRFWDSAGVGHLTVGGVSQSEQQNITVSAANLSTVNYVGGGAPGSETEWVQAYDGYEWGAWQSWTMSTVNHAPVVTAPDASVHPFQIVIASTLFSVTDADGDAITQYRFWDGGAGGGYFTINGTQQAAQQNITVAAANLSTVNYVGGSTAGSETEWVQAFDGTDWSAWQSWTMSTGNHAPVVTAPNRGVALNTAVAASTLFSVTDAENDAITQYRFWDGGAGGGFFTVGGAQQAAQQNITVAAANLSTVNYVGGATAGSETEWVQAFDGTDWSTWQSWTMTSRANNLPVVSAPNVTLLQNQWVLASSLFAVSDADNDSMTQYQFQDNTATAGSGYLWVNGATPAAGTLITVAAADLSTVWVRGGVNTGIDNLQVSAFDGFGWTNPTSFTLTTQLPNHAPVVTAPNGSIAPNASVLASTLFSVTDADNDAITQYRFWDGGAGGGHFTVGGVTQPAQQNINVNAAALSTVNYVGGATAGSETEWVQAFDGRDWSAWQSWTMATNTAPSVTASNYTLALGTRWLANTFFSAADADGNPISKVDLTAPSPTFNAFGSLIPPFPGTGDPRTYTSTGFDAFGLSMFAAAPGTYSVSARAFDGIDWSAAVTSNITVTAPPTDNGGTNASDAVQLTLGTPIAEWLGSGTADQSDAYKFTLPSTQNVHLQLSGYTNNTPGNAIAVTLQPLSGGAAINGTLNFQSSGMTADYSSLAAGQYLVQLTQPSNGQTNYNLAVSAS